MFWILMSIGLALLLYFSFVKPFYYWADRGVPSYKLWNVWLEFVLGVVRYRTIAETIQKVYNDFPGNRYFGAYRFFKPTFILKDLDLIKQITVKDFDHFVDHVDFIPEGAEPIWEKNLLSLKGDKWRDMRATLSPSFTGSKMKIMFGLMSDCATQFVQYFQEQDSRIVSVEMKDVFTRFTNDVIASTAFGVSCDSLKDRDNTFYLMGKKATTFGGNFWAFLKIISLIIFPRVSKIFGITLFTADVISFFRNVIKDNIQARERDGIVRPDMIHLLMEARKGRSQIVDGVDAQEGFGEKVEKRHKEQLTDEDITAQALIFFFAGFETVATLMSFMSYELAVQPDIQQRLRDEVDNTLNDCGGSVTYEALLKMKYMEMVISETLRKWPAMFRLDRVCVKPYKIQPIRDGETPVHLKKGEAIFVPIFGMHRDPEFFPEPDRFDPERFSEENKSSLNPYAYLPFGVGPRNCIGSRFALIETKLLFFHILSKFEITVIDKTPIPLKLDRKQVLLNAEGGFWLGLRKT